MLKESLKIKKMHLRQRFKGVLTTFHIKKFFLFVCFYKGINLGSSDINSADNFPYEILLEKLINLRYRFGL